MRTLLVTHPVFADHDTGLRHPERPARLGAALAGVRAGASSLIELDAPEVDLERLAAVHEPAYIEAIEQFCLAGGGALDPDTLAVAASWEAAKRAAGAGHLAVEYLSSGLAEIAFLVVRPPGHHAESARAMGFCLFNNIAVTAQELLGAGQRVAIVDWDVHHGNGTQSTFEASPDLLYISFHQHPFYPGTGAIGDGGVGDGKGTTVNFPFPAGTAGDVYRRAMTEVVIPILERFAPDWLLVSAGYDGHVDDPLAGIRLVAADYANMAGHLVPMVPESRTLFFLEGGYDLQAIAQSVAATLKGAEGRPADDGVTSLESPPAAHRVVEAVESRVAELL